MNKKVTIFSASTVKRDSCSNTVKRPHLAKFKSHLNFRETIRISAHPPFRYTHLLTITGDMLV